MGSRAGCGVVSVVALGVLAPLGGCLQKTSFTCSDDAQCGAGGQCEATGYCSFVAPDCSSGRRYGDVSGSYTHVCVDSTMIDGGVDAPLDGNAALDTDSDTINDAVDNCPLIPNTNQRDHDNDNVGDVCDNCPHIANSNQAAVLDTDAVGDACDPDNTRTDTQVLFEGFYDPLTNWVVDTGWSVSAGALRATATNPVIAYRDVAAPANLTVVMHANMTPAGSGTPNIGVLARLVNTTDFYRCALVNTRAEVAIHTLATGFTNLAQTNLTNPVMSDTNLSYDLTGATMSCKAYGGAVGVTLPASDANLTGTRVGIRMRDGTVAVDYLVIYSH